MQNNSERNNALRDQNEELASKMKHLVEQYETREDHIDKILKHKDLELQLVQAWLGDSLYTTDFMDIVNTVVNTVDNASITCCIHTAMNFDGLPTCWQCIVNALIYCQHVAKHCELVAMNYLTLWQCVDKKLSKGC